MGESRCEAPAHKRTFFIARRGDGMVFESSVYRLQNLGIKNPAIPVRRFAVVRVRVKGEEIGFAFSEVF